MISIITPSYNRAHMIKNAIESVLRQDVVQFEHIIIDGGSTDGTLAVLQQYPHLRVISESDQGMYDALNKGLEMATGEIIGFLNTDDMYAQNIFSKVAAKFAGPDVMAVTGHAIVFSEMPDGSINVINEYSPADKSLIENLTGAGAFFNAWFYRKSTFAQIGTFNPNYKIAGDRDFMFRFALNNLKYAAIDDLIYEYRMHQDSLTFDKNSEKRTWSANEYLSMIRFYLVKPNLPYSVRKLLIQAQTLETIDMAARSVWIRNHKNFIEYALEGWQHDYFWPLRFFLYVLRRGMLLFLKRVHLSC